jgi:hypothetical protein
LKADEDRTSWSLLKLPLWCYGEGKKIADGISEGLEHQSDGSFGPFGRNLVSKPQASENPSENRVGSDWALFTSLSFDIHLEGRKL